MATVVENARYILADIEANSNKFWNAQLRDDGTVSAQWGRVGETGASGEWGGGKTFFDRKCREKERKGYVQQRVLATSGMPGSLRAQTNERLERVAQEQIETNHDVVKALLARLARANVHSILQQTTLAYNEVDQTFSTPLGIVTGDAIAEARTLLTQIGDSVARDEYEGRDLRDAINRYLMLVPQNIGRARIDTKGLFPDGGAIQRANDLLDALQAALAEALAKPPLPYAPEPEEPAEQVFDLRLYLVEDEAEVERIRRKYQATQQDIHACRHLHVRAVYAVEIAQMQTAFEREGAPLGNVQELWHGTKLHNVLSILKSGMKLMPPNSPHVTGRMFGNGHYFSDQSTKSLNYAYGAAPGQAYTGYQPNCFMFLADVAMGKTYHPKDIGGKLPRPGFDSTFAEGNHIPHLRNNEMIVYRDGQVNLTRLVEFSPGGK